MINNNSSNNRSTSNNIKQIKCVDENKVSIKRNNKHSDLFGKHESYRPTKPIPKLLHLQLLIIMKKL